MSKFPSPHLLSTCDASGMLVMLSKAGQRQESAYNTGCCTSICMNPSHLRYRCPREPWLLHPASLSVTQAGMGPEKPPEKHFLFLPQLLMWSKGLTRTGTNNLMSLLDTVCQDKAADISEDGQSKTLGVVASMAWMLLSYSIMQVCQSNTFKHPISVLNLEHSS